MFTLTEDHLRSLFALANFELPDDPMIFFGLRGCLPLDEAGTDFAGSHRLEFLGPNYTHMRCTLGQWKPGGGFAVFPGSTVPHRRVIESAIPRNGVGVNQMAYCFLSRMAPTLDHRYFKGDHGLTSSLGPHRAFRNESRQPVWRTADDVDFQGDDRIEVEAVFDNLHCARQSTVSAPKYSSNGCQVIAGEAGVSITKNRTAERGPWKKFVLNAYGLAQTRFAYALFDGREAQRTVELGAASRAPTVRFGSTGELARLAQQALIAAGFDLGPAAADGVFGATSFKTLKDAQQRHLSVDSVDGVFGPSTAEALGVSWPGPGGVATRPTPGLGADDLGAGATLRSEDDDFDPANAAAAAGAVAPLAGELPEFSCTPRRESAGNGKMRWVFVDPEDGKTRYLGGETKFDGFRGLVRIKGFGAEEGNAEYRFEEYEPEFGHWAAFIDPTGLGESQRSFTCLNSYDRAAFTFGFYQFAAHTPKDNLILLFRGLLTLPEAKRYFPDLTLSDGKVAQVTPGGPVDLEGARKRADGMSRQGEQGRFMEYLNSDMKAIDEAERRAGARLIHWAIHSPGHRRMQVEISIEHAKRKLQHANRKLREDHNAALDGQSIAVCAMAGDVLHQGRGGGDTFKKIARALRSANKVDALAAIGDTSVFHDRIVLVRKRIKDLLERAPFEGLKFDASAGAFG